MQLRVESGPDLGGAHLPSWATVEWMGRGGHSSSYGLLTGTRADVSRITIMDTGAHHRKALASRVDHVVWGLPEEYEPAVLAALDQEPQRLLISHAAHGEIGSSPLVFTALTRLLCRLLAAGVPADEDDLWRLWG